SALACDIVFESPPLQHLEYKGNFILKRVFGGLCENYLNGDSGPVIDFLPDDFSRRLEREAEVRPRMRVLCDFLAGMTDNYAVRFYKRLFSPDFGVINE